MRPLTVLTILFWKMKNRFPVDSPVQNNTVFIIIVKSKKKEYHIQTNGIKKEYQLW